MLEPLTSDGVDFVHQGALIVMAKVMVKINASSDTRVGTFKYCTYFVRHSMFFLAVACYFIIFRLLLVMLISDSGYTIIIYNFLFVL